MSFKLVLIYIATVLATDPETNVTDVINEAVAISDAITESIEVTDAAIEAEAVTDASSHSEEVAAATTESPEQLPLSDTWAVVARDGDDQPDAEPATEAATEAANEEVSELATEAVTEEVTEAVTATPVLNVTEELYPVPAAPTGRLQVFYLSETSGLRMAYLASLLALYYSYRVDNPILRHLAVGTGLTTAAVALTPQRVRLPVSTVFRRLLARVRRQREHLH